MPSTVAPRSRRHAPSLELMVAVIRTGPTPHNILVLPTAQGIARGRRELVAPSRYGLVMAKTDVVVLQGWMMEPGIWAHQEAALADGARPHAIIQPGHGVAVSRLRQQATMQDWAAWLGRELDGRAIGDAVVVGHDVGGLVAHEMWRRSPERVKALVFVATLDEPWSETEQASREALSGAVLDWNVESAARVSRALIGANFLSEQPNWFEDWRGQGARPHDLPIGRGPRRPAGRPHHLPPRSGA